MRRIRQRALTYSAGGSSPTGSTRAIELALGFATGPSVGAWSGRARVVHHLAVGPREAVGTRAEVMVRRRVLTSSIVKTRFVGPAIVEI